MFTSTSSSGRRMLYIGGGRERDTENEKKLENKLKEIVYDICSA